ncbi:MAG: hypothetical protein E3J72_03705 [Planctomycetota bacterium]|nr:MAG: hypothetical protein E3J72_03705 [Planctomycetota bacterium]
MNLRTKNGILYNVDYEKFLDENGLKGFDDFYNLEPDAVVKRVRDERATMRVKLKSGGGERIFYLKRTVYNPLLEAARTVLKWTKQFNNMVHEFEACRRFLEAGLPTAVPVAAGRRGSIRRVETFCLSAGLGETEKLEDYAPKRFSPPLDGGRIREKHSLAKKIGRLARKMHDSGFNHRDFYLCHVHRFVDGGGLAILDLNRAAFFPGGVLGRWVVKDLAALDAGPVPDGVLHATDRLRCFKSYLGREGKMTAEDRELLKQVNTRAAALRVRGEKSRRRDAEYMSREAAGGG